MKRYLFLTGFIVLIVVGLAITTRKSGQRDAFVVLRGERFSVEIADEENEQAQGLSGRDSLCQKCGMLFVYPKAAPRTFWMKDMKFPLDFVWLREGRVVELTPNVSAPATNEPPTVISPREFADAVFEVPAGTIERRGLKIGETIITKK